MRHDNDISPTRSGISCIGDDTVCYRINSVAAIGIAARVLVPVFAQMVIFTKILSIEPIIRFITCLGHIFCLADRIGERIGNDRRVFLCHLSILKVAGDRIIGTAGQ